MFSPHFGVAFRSIAHGATVGLVTTLISCSLAVAVERSSISAMYKYKPELFEEAYAKGVLQQHKLGGEKGWSDEGMAGVMATSSAKTEP
mmetsp:Transcript_29065/g.58062  ORF Transcript_29065/g.58062 Transcript_29065/m.58062 type:complete len:89 (+) Transcript_29065:447-713(+)